MHNKFCIIDNKTLINGSYNWTYYAEDRNRENIIIIKEEQETIDAFTKEFERLKALTKKEEQIMLKTKFEVDESNLLRARDYLANDIVFQAKTTGNYKIINAAFQIAPDNIEVQKTAFELKLTKKRKLKFSIGSSLKNNKYLVIAPKGSYLPILKTEIVKTSEHNQISSTSTIHYGENPLASLNPKIGTMTVKGIPPKPAGEAKLKFYFTIDIYGNIRIEKFSLDNGSKDVFGIKLPYLFEEVTA